MKVQKEDKKTIFWAENEEEKKVLTNDAFVVRDVWIERTRFYYFSKPNSSPLYIEASQTPYLYNLIRIANYLYDKEDFEALKKSGLPYLNDDGSKTYKSNIIYFDFKKKKVINPHKEMKWGKQ